MDPPVQRGANRLPLVHMRLVAAFACAMTIGSTAVAQVTTGRSGWDAIREGRNEDAAAAFAEAIRAEPRDPSHYLRAGLAAQLLGHTARASGLLEQAVGFATSVTVA